jgi:translation initiation factor IF-1
VPSQYELSGVVDKILGNNNYSVLVGEGEGARAVLCHLSGKMRRFNISVIPGDEVTLELPPPHDKGRITFRGKKEDLPPRNARESRQKRRGRR